MTTRATSSETSYRGTTIALLTLHGKEEVIAPLLATSLGARCLPLSGFDTDLLGTFTRETPRDGSQLEAARKKARLGVELSRLPFAIGSEGSFTPGPMGLYAVNLEMVLLLDDVRGIEIVGRAKAPGCSVQAYVSDHRGLEEVARRAGFPEHGLVVRPSDASDPRIRKGLRTWDSLRSAFSESLAESASGVVFVENDLRAHMNPTRMSNIRQATADLLERMVSSCPACASPGFGLATALPGLPCRDCGQPTDEIGTACFGCVACNFDQVRLITDRRADPFRCEHCNP